MAQSMNSPTFKQRLGLLAVAVFENQKDDGRHSMRTVSVSRRYFDRKKDAWETTQLSLGESDVSAARALLEQIETYLLQSSTADQPAE